MSTLIEKCNELAHAFVQTRNKKYAAKVLVNVLQFAKLEHYILQELWYKHEVRESEVQAAVNQPKISVKTFAFIPTSPNSQFDFGTI